MVSLCNVMTRVFCLPGILFLIVSMFLPETSLAQDRVIEAYRINDGPELNGILDESCWQQARPAAQFTQQRPDEGEAVSERTEVRVVYNDQTLYLGVSCYDTQPDQIIATQMRRDGDLEDDDYFQIILDTFFDQQNGFLFATNPDGARFDSQIRNEGRSEGQYNTNMITEWDGVWDVITTRTDAGWFAEIAIPWRTLRFEAGEDMVFGVNFERQIRRRNEQAFWAPVVKPFEITRVSMAGKMAGLNLAQQTRRNIQVKPYSLGGAQWTYGIPSTIRNDDLDGGVDLKYGITSNLTTDLTYNTDFSQAEVDEAQINLTQFSLFFPEKREFFMENAGLFSFGVPRETEIFYSRQIGLARDSTGTLREVPIVAGGRMTGKVGRSNLGLLLMRTGDEQFGTQTINDNTYAVARVSRDLFDKSNVGVIFTNRQSTGGDYNRAYGVDFNLIPGSKLAISGFFAGTDSDGSNNTGYAGRIRSTWRDPLWQFEGYYTDISQNFDPEMGFFSQQSLAATYGGYRSMSGRIAFTPEPEASIVRRFYPHVQVDAALGHDGTQLTRHEHFHYFMSLRGGEDAGITLDRNFQRISATSSAILGVNLPIGTYTYTSTRMHFNTNQSKPIFGDFEFTIGQFFNGNRRTFTFEGGIRYGSRLAFEPRYELNDVELTDINALKQDITAHIIGLRTSYSFSPNISARSLVQWNSQSERFSANFRFNYIIRPGSDLFIVYNERRDSNTGGFPGDPMDRAIVVKLAYLFNL